MMPFGVPLSYLAEPVQTGESEIQGATVGTDERLTRYLDDRSSIS